MRRSVALFFTFPPGTIIFYTRPLINGFFFYSLFLWRTVKNRRTCGEYCVIVRCKHKRPQLLPRRRINSSPAILISRECEQELEDAANFKYTIHSSSGALYLRNWFSSNSHMMRIVQVHFSALSLFFMTVTLGWGKWINWCSAWKERRKKRYRNEKDICRQEKHRYV